MRRTASVTAPSSAAIASRPSALVPAALGTTALYTAATAPTSIAVDVPSPVVCRRCAGAADIPMIASANAKTEIRFTRSLLRKGTNCTPYAAPHFEGPQEGSQTEAHGGPAPRG